MCVAGLDAIAIIFEVKQIQGNPCKSNDCSGEKQLSYFVNVLNQSNIFFSSGETCSL